MSKILAYIITGVVCLFIGYVAGILRAVYVLDKEEREERETTE